MKMRCFINKLREDEATWGVLAGERVSGVTREEARLIQQRAG